MPSASRLIAAGAAVFLLAGAAMAQSRTTLADGAILLDGRPFPMVVDAGTDCFTPQDYDTVMASKDAWGANTWWLQYSMRHMKSETEGDFSGLARELDFFARTGMMVNLYVRGEYRDVPARSTRITAWWTLRASPSGDRSVSSTRASAASSTATCGPWRAPPGARSRC